VPRRFQAFQAKVRNLHPEWRYLLWTDEDNDRFVKERFPSFLNTFRGYPKAIMRADAIRYLLLYQLGGLYLDLDYEMLSPFDLRHYAVVLPLETDSSLHEGGRLGNALMAAVPMDPLFLDLIEALQSDTRQDDDVLERTGPEFLTRVVRNKLSMGRTDVFLPAREMFSPTSPRTAREYRRIIDSGRSYGVHHCIGSWREFNQWDRIRHEVGTMARRLRIR